MLVFFGFVATLGSAYVQYRTLPAEAWWGALAVGLPACGILLANNVRDVATDTVAGKRTLAVRIGAARARLMYAGCLGGALVAVVGLRVLASVGAHRAGRRAARDHADAARADAYRSAVARRRARCARSATSWCWPRCSRSACASASVVSARELGDHRAERRRAARAAARGRLRSPRASRRRAAVEHAARDRGELLVACPGHEQHRHGQLRQAVPHRLHRTGPELPQARGEERGRERPPVGEAGRVAAEPSRTSAAPATARGTRRPPPRSASAAHCFVGLRPARPRSAASSMPGVPLTSTSPRTTSGRSSARRKQSRPPIE